MCLNYELVNPLLGAGAPFFYSQAELWKEVMHLLILSLTLLGPFSHDIIVVPWNIGMIFILFWNKCSLTFLKQISFLKALVMIIFFLMTYKIIKKPSPLQKPPLLIPQLLLLQL